MDNFYAKYPVSGGGGGSGTVTSVALAAPAIFTVTGSPITTSGTIALTLVSESANTFFAAPDGSAGTPVFRAIVAADIPTLNQNTTGTASNITATSNNTLSTLSSLSLPYSQVTGGPSTNGITGLTGDVQASGPGSVLATIQPGAVPLTSSKVSGILPLTKGGTNNNLVPNNNRVMVTSGGVIVEAPAITASSALVSNASGIPIASPTTSGELGFLSGVTSSVQTQLNAKQATGNYITALTGDGTATGPGSVALTVTRINGVALSGLATGILKNTTTTGVPSIAVAADFPTLNQNTTGTAANITATTNATLTTISSLVSVGTITTGVWSGTAISAIKGGTAQTTYATGDTLYASAANTLSKLTIGATGTVLTVAGGVPTWAAASPNLTISAVKTTTYAILTTDLVVLTNAGTASFTATLPTAVGVTGKQYIIKRVDQTLANSVTIATTSSQTIDGVTTKALATQYESFTIVSDGANWQVLDHNIPGNWVSYTPALTAFGTPTGVSFLWKRDGDTLYVQGTFTSGTPTASQALCPFPDAGLTATSGAASGNHWGTWIRQIAGGTVDKGGVLIPVALGSRVIFTDTTTFGANSTTGSLTSQNANSIVASGTLVSLQFSAPITQWTY